MKRDAIQFLRVGPTCTALVLSSLQIGGVGCGLPPSTPPPLGDTDGYKTFFAGEQNNYGSPIGNCPTAGFIDITLDDFRQALEGRSPPWQGVYEAISNQHACLQNVPR